MKSSSDLPGKGMDRLFLHCRDCDALSFVDANGGEGFCDRYRTGLVAENFDPVSLLSERCFARCEDCRKEHGMRFPSGWTPTIEYFHRDLCCYSCQSIVDGFCMRFQSKKIFKSKRDAACILEFGS